MVSALRHASRGMSLIYGGPEMDTVVFFPTLDDTISINLDLSELVRVQGDGQQTPGGSSK